MKKGGRYLLLSRDSRATRRECVRNRLHTRGTQEARPCRLGTGARRGAKSRLGKLTRRLRIYSVVGPLGSTGFAALLAIGTSLGIMYILGLTGSIGMGKSTVGSMFKDAGIPLLDADEQVHKLYAGLAVEPVGAAFPGCVVNGAVDRSILSTYVLGPSNADNLAKLESIVHPLVAKDRQQFIEESASKGHTLVVMDIPLLFEKSLQSEVDGIAVVSATAENQRARVLARSGMTAEKFDNIRARQIPDSEKRKSADFIIDTNGSMDSTRQAVAEIISAVSRKEGKLYA